MDKTCYSNEQGIHRFEPQFSIKNAFDESILKVPGTDFSYDNELRFPKPTRRDVTTRPIPFCSWSL